MVQKTPSIVKSPQGREVYAKLIEVFRILGPFEVEEKKTSLHVVHGRAFAGVHPRASGLVLNLVLDRPVQSPRVHRSEPVSAHRHHVEFRLERASEVDAELSEWISRAYALTV